MKQHKSVCAGCSTGCSVFIEENQDRVYRLKPRENPLVNQWWMCDEGRYGFKHVHSNKRRTEPRRRNGEELENVDWSVLPDEIDTTLRSSERLAAVISPHLTVEEAYLLATYVRRIDRDAILAVGPIPVVGEDETFPSGFTIRAEKCPNRHGVELIVGQLSERLVSFREFVDDFASMNISALWVTGGYKSDWIDYVAASTLADVPTLIVQDMFTSPLWDRATYQLPGVSFAERHGSYVNVDGRLQSFDWAVRPPAGAMIEGQLYWRLLGRMGMYDPPAVLQEIAREIAQFAPAIGEVPESGVDLKVNQLADAPPGRDPIATGVTG